MTAIFRTQLRAAGALTATVFSVSLLAGCATPSEQDDATALAVPGTGAAAACAPLTAENMAAADTAFRGTVTAIEDGQVTLRVDEEFIGDIDDVVTVPQQPADQPSELSIGAFTVGTEYLISANDGVILTCGQSGPATAELTALYDAAF